MFVKNQPTLQRPKTRQGERSVALPDVGRDLLQRLPRSRDPETPIFTTPGGKPPLPGTVRYTLQRLCQQAEVPLLNVHGLRHVHTAMLLAGGIDPQALRRRLGHAHVSLTLDRDAYAVRTDADAARALDDAGG